MICRHLFSAELSFSSKQPSGDAHGVQTSANMGIQERDDKGLPELASVLRSKFGLPELRNWVHMYNNCFY